MKLITRSKGNCRMNNIYEFIKNDIDGIERYAIING